MIECKREILTTDYTEQLNWYHTHKSKTAYPVCIKKGTRGKQDYNFLLEKFKGNITFGRVAIFVHIAH